MTHGFLLRPAFKNLLMLRMHFYDKPHLKHRLFIANSIGNPVLPISINC